VRDRIGTGRNRSYNAAVARPVRPARGLIVAIPVGVLLATIAIGWSAEASFESTGPATVRLTDRQLTLKRVSAGDSGMGDVEIARFTLFAPDSATRPIGHAVLSCTFVSRTERSCNGAYVVPRGMILTSGLLTTRLLYSAAIIGGTGLYDNARGTLTVTAKGLKPRRELLLFRLSG
jgi:hypothetical protein